MSGFNDIARHYNAMTGFPARIDRLVELIRPWIDEWQVHRALDSGCGNGALLFALQRCAVETVGIDSSEPMLRLALQNARELRTKVTLHGATHATAAHLYPESFDAVFALGNALIGASDEREMIDWLTGLYGALRPGGHLLLQNLNLTPFLRGNKSLISRREAGGCEYTRFAKPSPLGGLTFCLTIRGTGGEFDAQVSHWSRWEGSRVAACVAGAGFREIAMYGSLERDAFDPRSSTDLVIAAAK